MGLCPVPVCCLHVALCYIHKVAYVKTRHTTHQQNAHKAARRGVKSARFSLEHAGFALKHAGFALKHACFALKPACFAPKPANLRAPKMPARTGSNSKSNSACSGVFP